jgi:hypothetical protein
VPPESDLVAALTTTNYLSKEDVNRRARLLFQDLQRLQIEGFRLLPVERYPARAGFPEIRLAEYHFGPVEFGLENAKNPASVQKTVREMEGTAINREDILYLSKISEMAHTLIPRMWAEDSRLLRDVRLSSQHLDTLNEIWWLGRWDGLTEQSLRREVVLVPGSTKSVDWQFRLTVRSEEWTINLEVKRLIHSIGARAYSKDHWFYKPPLADGSFDEADPRRKFHRSSNKEINILGITWFDDISAELESEIQRFLDEDDRIDAVIVCALGDRAGRGGWIRFFPRFREMIEKRRTVASVLLEPDEEDRTRIIAFVFPRTWASIQAEVANLSAS